MGRSLEIIRGNLVLDAEVTLPDGRTVHTLVSLSGMDCMSAEPGTPPGLRYERRVIREACKSARIPEAEIRKRLDAGEKIPF